MPEYTIQSGDTLSGIARDLGVPLGALLESNPGIANPNKIKAGEVLKLPGYPMGSVTTEFNPQTNPTWQSPFAMFPTAGAGSTGSWPGSLDAGGPMGLTKPMPAGEANPFDWNSPNRPPGVYPDEVMQRVYDTAKGVVASVSDFVADKIPRAMRGEMNPEELAGFGLESAALVAGGGAFGTRPNPMGKPLPMGQPRHLPTQQRATGTMGLAQRAQKAGALNDAGVDPMWIDTVMLGKPPTGNVRGPVGEFSLGSGPVKGDNVVPFDPSRKKLTDPKTNLERRMARRTGEGEVLPQSRFEQAQVDRYEKQARAERPHMTNKQKGQAERNAAYNPMNLDPKKQYRMKETDPDGNTMTATMSGKRWTDRMALNNPPEIMSKATRDKKLKAAGVKDVTTLANKDETGSMRKLMDLHKEFKAGKPLTEATTKGEVQKRLDQLVDMLRGIDDIEFPAIAGTIGGAAAAVKGQQAPLDDRNIQEGQGQEYTPEEIHRMRNQRRREGA